MDCMLIHLPLFRDKISLAQTQLHKFAHFNSDLDLSVIKTFALVRYPDDKYDRLWYAPGDWANSVQALTNSTDTPSVTASSKNNNVPPKVMQDAWLNNTANSSIFFSFTGLDSSIDFIYAAAYTEEIQSHPSGYRVFDGYANSDNIGVGITPSTYAELSSNDLVSLRATVLNFSFEADISSPLGPIVNAVEAYAIYDMRNSSTLQADGMCSLERRSLTVSIVPSEWLVCSS